jgi:hypothetical protein
MNSSDARKIGRRLTSNSERTALGFATRSYFNCVQSCEPA